MTGRAGDLMAFWLQKVGTLLFCSITMVSAPVPNSSSNIKLATKKTAIAMQLFGRAGAELIPMLNAGSAAMKYWIDYGTKVGAVLSDEDAANAKAFTQELTKLHLIFEGLENRLMKALLPALDHLTSALATLVGNGPAMQGFGKLVGDALLAIAKAGLDSVEAMYMIGDAFAHVKLYMSQFDKDLGLNNLKAFKDAMT